jgi:site-specific DNA recombinase
MKAAIYCRVSTEGQEQDGMSLQTQFEALAYKCNYTSRVTFQLQVGFSKGIIEMKL